jgi:zinc transport system substrate-binding protein
MRKLLFSILLTLLPIFAQADDGFKVIASIKPIHSLVTAVTDGVVEPDLLIGSATSEHTYSLLPADMKKMQTTNVIFITSYDLERFLKRPLQNLKKNITIVELMKSEGMTFLPIRHLNLNGAEEEEDDHHHGAIDPHVWLSPDNAIIMVREIEKTMSKKDAKNAAKYKKNAAATIAKIKATADAVKGKLAPYSKTPYITFHDGYQYFEKYFGLNFAGAISIPSHEGISAGRLKEIENITYDKDAKCVFNEPQFSQSAINAISENLKINVGSLDYMGMRIEAGKDAYNEILHSLADSMVECFSKD